MRRRAEQFRETFDKRLQKLRATIPFIPQRREPKNKQPLRDLPSRATQRRSGHTRSPSKTSQISDCECAEKELTGACDCFLPPTEPGSVLDLEGIASQTSIAPQRLGEPGPVRWRNIQPLLPRLSEESMSVPACVSTPAKNATSIGETATDGCVYGVKTARKITFNRPSVAVVPSREDASKVLCEPRRMACSRRFSNLLSRRGLSLQKRSESTKEKRMLEQKRRKHADEETKGEEQEDEKSLLDVDNYSVDEAGDATSESEGVILKEKESSHLNSAFRKLDLNLSTNSSTASLSSYHTCYSFQDEAISPLTTLAPHVPHSSPRLAQDIRGVVRTVMALQLPSPQNEDEASAATSSASSGSSPRQGGLQPCRKLPKPHVNGAAGMSEFATEFSRAQNGNRFQRPHVDSAAGLVELPADTGGATCEKDRNDSPQLSNFCLDDDAEVLEAAAREDTAAFEKRLGI